MMPEILNEVKRKETSFCFLFQVTGIQQIGKQIVEERLETCVTGHPAFWKSAKDQEWDTLTEAKNV